MTVRTLSSFLAEIRERKAALGMTDDPDTVEAMRNKGGRRTAAKRELLRRAEARARAAGVTPVKAYF